MTVRASELSIRQIESQADRESYDWAHCQKFQTLMTYPDASLQTSVNFPRMRPLKCMEQSAFLLNLNQERIEMTKTLKNIVKYIISYALLMRQKISWSICGFHGPKTTRP